MQKKIIQQKGVEIAGLDESLVTAFERVSTKFSSRVALGSNVWEPTYRELNETANRLAHRLIAHGATLGDRAAILMSHDAPMVAAVLGILKAGQIVLPLDPGEPLSRLKMIVEDAEPSVVITDAQNHKLAARFAPPNSVILDFESETTVGTIENPSLEIPPEQTAFLIYTSGTTGRPKGVMRAHRQILAINAAYTEAMQCNEDDRIPLLAAVSTGQGSSGVCWPLLNGAMLCPFPVKTKGVTGLANWIIDRRLTFYASSASIFRTLVKTIDDRLVFSNVRAVRLASEAVTTDDIRSFKKHFPSTSIFVHTLSSSETPTIAWFRWTENDNISNGVLPVGHIAKNIEVSLLGDDGQPVARGGVGEIMVKSRYVAKGYWRDPQLTAERFSDDLDGKGTRLVRTGDRARINADGMLEFCGRKDDRIKIRGNRIEPIDIERALERVPGVERAAAVAVRRENHEPLLVAFVVKTSDASLTAQRLRHALKANLPLHMMPSRIVFLESLPYNIGNKIDRVALRQYSLPVRDGDKGNQPRTETEILLADIWAEIFELPDIGQDDDFFNLGGDSLSGAVVAARLYASLGVELSLDAIADHPTVSALAAFIDESRRAGATEAPPVVRVPRAATMPMSLSQEFIWNRRQEDGAYFTHVRSYRIIGPLDIGVLKQCLSYLIGRHEILRTNFDLVEGSPAQVIHESSHLDLSFVDLIDAVDPEGQADSLIREASTREIDLKKLPIVRYVVIRIANNNYRLVYITHPLIIDGFSSQILNTEFATLYETMLLGKEPPLPKVPPLQYADYAVWQRQVMRPDGPYFNEVMGWWKSLTSTGRRATRLPFRRLIRRAPVEASEGVLQWSLEKQVAKQLDGIARSAGATHFTIRLAAFAALIADVTASATIIIGTAFANRNRVETQNIVGPFQDTVHLIFSYDANKTFIEWLEFVRDCVFDATRRGELPYDLLRTSGIEPPDIEFYFTMPGDHPDQNFGNLVISKEFYSVGIMPRKCMFAIDERKPENCRVNFDANIYDRNEMRLMLDRYLRLLEAVACAPELPVGKLLVIVGKRPLRWTCANYAAPFFEFVTAFYDSSPQLKMFWRFIKKWL
jgi:amino acid adenylation domain-containing protein